MRSYFQFQNISVVAAVEPVEAVEVVEAVEAVVAEVEAKRLELTAHLENPLHRHSLVCECKEPK